MDLNGTLLANFDFGGNGPEGSLWATAAAAAPRGNLVIVGYFGGLAGFPLVSPLFPAITGRASFIIKLDAELRGILFSTFFPGDASTVAVDPAGNIYLTGSTTASDFPLSPGTYQTKAPAHDRFGSARYAFLTALSPAGDRILYSTYFGADGVSCSGGGSCIGVYGRTSATAIALDRSGAVVIAGVTDARDLPTTPGALGPTCLCSSKSSAGFVAKFSAGAKALEWSTFVNATQSLDFLSGVGIGSLALDPLGNIIVAGGASNFFPTTAGVLQPTLSSSSGGFIAKLNGTGTSLIWSTYFGSSLFEKGVSALANDP